MLCALAGYLKLSLSFRPDGVHFSWDRCQPLTPILLPIAMRGSEWVEVSLIQQKTNITDRLQINFPYINPSFRSFPTSASHPKTLSLRAQQTSSSRYVAYPVPPPGMAYLGTVWLLAGVPRYSLS